VPVQSAEELLYPWKSVLGTFKTDLAEYFKNQYADQCATEL